VAVAGLMQGFPDGVGRDGGQTIAGPTQRLLQSGQGPTGRAVVLRRGHPLGLAKDAGAGRLVINPPPPATVARGERLEALAVETGDEGGNGGAGPAADGESGLLVIGAVSDQQQKFGAGDLCGWGNEGPTEAVESFTFLIGKGTERVFLATRHGPPPGRHPRCISDERYGHTQSK